MAETYDIYFGTTSGNLTLQEASTAVLSVAMPVTNVLGYSTDYYWRIDATNAAGTTTGDEWGFSTINISPPLPTGLTLDGSGGTTGTPIGENNVITVKRLIAAAKNGIYYEDR